MAEVKMTADGLIGLDYDPRRYISAPAWSSMGIEQASSQHRSDIKRPVSPLQTSCHAFDPTAALAASAHDHALIPDWGLQPVQPHLQYATTQPTAAETPFTSAYLQPSPMELMPVTEHLESSLLSGSYLPLAPVDIVPYTWQDFQPDLASFAPIDGLADMFQSHHLPDTSSPTDTYLEVRSLTSSTSDNSWTLVDNRRSMDPYHDQNVFINPNQTLHNRSLSESSYSDLDHNPRSSFGSFVEVSHAMHSPSSSESTLESEYNASFQRRVSSDLASHASSSPPTAVSPVTMTRPIPMLVKKSGATSLSRSPKQAAGSPPSRKPSRKSPIAAKNADTKVRKQTDPNKPEKEKRVGKRKGPLKPDQRKQASEIRKLRACLRCKFLKKTCDKGEPCAGCKPSHARLWQVPCTRIDIKEIGYFMKDWKADYERHVTLGFSVGNITGFSDVERTLFITHGYGQVLPVKAREVYVRDEECFNVDWVESLQRNPSSFELKTSKLSAGMEGISTAILSDYLDRHIDGNGSFERFVDDYFGGTPFLTQMLKTAFRFYFRTKMPVIRKALKLILAYNLTLHVTMVEGLGELEDFVGKVEDETSMYNGKVMAPVMINFQIKCAMANMWRDLQKDVLEELSALYSSVYSGEKLKNWPTIFILASILLAVWEEMQFDCHYRVPDPVAVNKFCTDMETTPVGVIVGLFQAISQKLPAFTDWNSQEHHHLLNSNPDVCDAMTEVREHVRQHESYLRTRSNSMFDRNDFDCLSNKFLSRLVLRSNQATREVVHAM
ncbi:C6 zinc finger domain-containing protein [Coccidioides immitis RS]|uniref:C6 zinc finger domain-containing protein n=5 Tax=Coccidioides TaxID=5500 RepID=A0A0E1S4I5_COCIM|nr:C6 zinc finger domain-containing protein [Coccidioides immitis RS]XP_003066450.1 Fungal Zn binuclear cluster domain containing protein [Coccidioides posadasii C735 delta SOWgp]KMM65977.1 hypothetical protein CPAG_02318 [Coccidioides posadasii RMSCC 3488]QVM10818.1 hypothetical protein D8B26_005471 [Coccidioides posadasii str. Silveira]EAS35212.2 C6 zinc finger domain-containing protein [Coccidioides immitis RS]EER24305.1 Fungal Zn binuclear cluster domain containing protein [Coccidioides po|eukprot:XP_003066450.1 Fungal Zn binuclear cluster domain containing protein [Coccidioides posadasii C735 delta SOWgp]